MNSKVNVTDRIAEVSYSSEINVTLLAEKNTGTDYCRKVHCLSM